MSCATARLNPTFAIRPRTSPKPTSTPAPRRTFVTLCMHGPVRGACRRFFLLASGTRLAPALVMAAYGAPLNPAQPVRAHVVRDGADSAGLSEAEARGRLERDGPNELTARGTPHPIVRFVKKLFAQPARRRPPPRVHRLGRARGRAERGHHRRHRGRQLGRRARPDAAFRKGGRAPPLSGRPDCDRRS